MVYEGYLYSTLADVPVDVNQRTCQCQGYDNDGIYWDGPGYVTIPSGWSLANDDSDSKTVIAAHYWSTKLMVVGVYSTYSSYYGSYSYYGSEYFTLQGPSCCNSNAGSYWTGVDLYKSGSSYTVHYCDSQILITSK